MSGKTRSDNKNIQDEDEVDLWTLHSKGRAGQGVSHCESFAPLGLVPARVLTHGSRPFGRLKLWAAFCRRSAAMRRGSTFQIREALLSYALWGRPIANSFALIRSNTGEDVRP
jgi:hypothetical protein